MIASIAPAGSVIIHDINIEPIIRRFNIGLFYFSNFRNGWNYPEVLTRRFRYAQEIIEILKKEKIFNNKSYENEFTKK